MNERVIVLDFESEHLVFKTPHGDVTKRFSFLSVNGTRRAGFASCFIDFDMLNQNAYKITFKSPEERQEFEEAVSALISQLINTIRSPKELCDAKENAVMLLKGLTEQSGLGGNKEEGSMDHRALLDAICRADGIPPLVHLLATVCSQVR